MTRAVALAAAAALACGCGRAAQQEGDRSMGPMLAPELAAVRGARVLFLHHSVGRNVLAGVEALDRDAGGGAIREATPEQAASEPGPLLAHFSGGRNQDPRSKMDAFAAALLAEPRARVDLALMKLCYVDFEPGTDVPALFAHYRETIAAIRRARPDLRLAHVTVPLKARPTDLKSRVKRLLGKEVWEDAANARRAEFNRLLAEAFAGDAIFDLAGVESTGPDGAVTTFERDGSRVPSLFPGYTDDGGHLNAAGQRAAGVAAVRFLAGALARPVAAR